MRFLAAMVALSVSLFWGCFLPDPHIPADAEIVCEDDSECPEGFVCAPILGRCVNDSDDSTAPSVISETIVITPATAGVGDTVSVGFEVDETLALDPVVHFDFSGAPTFSLHSQTDLAYVFTAEIAGTEPEGNAVILVDLVDLVGNPLQDHQLGTITIDF